MTDENNQIKFFLYENWARTKTGQHTVIHKSCVGNMMNNFTSPYTLRPTFTQMALRPFVIVFKWLYCPSRDLIGWQNISVSE